MATTSSATAQSMSDETLGKLIRDVITMHWRVNMSRAQIAQHLVMNGEEYEFPEATTDFIRPIVDEICDAENSRIRAANREMAAEFSAAMARLRETPSFRRLMDDITRAGGKFRGFR